MLELLAVEAVQTVVGAHVNSAVGLFYRQHFAVESFMLRKPRIGRWHLHGEDTLRCGSP